MAKKRIENGRPSQDGKAYNDGTGQYKYFNTDGDQAITVGEYILWRLTLTMPKNSVVSDATFRTEYIVKNGATLPQSFGYNAWIEIDAPEYPLANDNYLGAVGTFPPLPRKIQPGGISGTLNYTVNTPEADFFTMNLTTPIQNIVNRTDYVPGMSITVILNPTSESGDISIRMLDHVWATEHPSLTVQYTEPFSDDRRWDINLLDNSSFEIDIEDWYVNAAYDYYVTTTTVSRSTEQKRDGAASLKVASGPAETGKNFGVMSGFIPSPMTSYVFCGWVYVPSSNPNNILPQFQYSVGGPQITAKDQWVPFCTNVLTIGATPSPIWPSISGGPSGTGNTFYVDGLCLIESKHRQMPFTGDSPKNNLATYMWQRPETKKDASVRVTRARTQAFTTPIRVLDTTNAFSPWTQPAQSQVAVTFVASSGGIMSTVGTAPVNGTERVRFTKNLSRTKRFLSVNSTGTTPLTLTRIGLNGDDDLVNPLVVATEGNRKFYDLGQESSIVTFLEWTINTSASTAGNATVFDISESEYPSAVAALRPGANWIRREDGIWHRADPERQTPTIDETTLTWTQLAALNKTWDQLEATDGI